MRGIVCGVAVLWMGECGCSRDGSEKVRTGGDWEVQGRNGAFGLAEGPGAGASVLGESFCMGKGSTLCSGDRSGALSEW